MDVGAVPAVPTPAATVPAFPTAVLELRAATSTGVSAVGHTTTNYNTYSYNSNCYNFDNELSCASYIEGCAYGYNYNTDYSALESSYSSCFCASGLQYLNCYFTALSQSSCANYLGISDWPSYETSWFVDYCGGLPASVMDQIQPPTSVSLEFETVPIVTATGPVPATTHAQQPIYSNTGNLLTGVCSSTSFTLVEAGATVYWAAFIGCNSANPECCPWTAATNGGQALPATGSTQVTVTGTNPVTLTVGAASTGGVAANVGGNYPVPADPNQMTLQHCPADYYARSGHCCPTGFWPFTTDVGGQTPCWSSHTLTGHVPTLTAGLSGEPTDTSKPTSAVVNIVWAMQYPVATSSGGSGLSTAAVAGIGAGAGVVGIILAIIGTLCCLRYRKKRLAKKQGQTANPAVGTSAAAVPGAVQQQPMYTGEEKMPVQQQVAAYPAPHTYPQQQVAQQQQYAQQPPQQQILQPQPQYRHPTPGYAGSGYTSSTPAPSTPTMLSSQHTGASAQTPSEIGSSYSGQALVASAVSPGYYPPGGNGAVRTTSPVSSNGGQAFSPIAEVNEQGGQYGYPPQQVAYAQGQGQGQQQFYPPQGPVPVQQQAPYPPQVHQYVQQQQEYQQPQPHQYVPDQGAQQQHYHHQQESVSTMQTHVQEQGQQHQHDAHAMPEMSAGREVDPPQEVVGSVPKE